MFQIIFPFCSYFWNCIYFQYLFQSLSHPKSPNEKNQFTWNKVFQIIFPSSRKTISHTLYIFPTFVFPSKITQTRIKKHLSTSIIKRSKLFSPLLLLFETIRFKHRFISLAHKKIKSEGEKSSIRFFFSLLSHFLRRDSRYCGFTKLLSRNQMEMEGKQWKRPCRPRRSCSYVKPRNYRGSCPRWKGSRSTASRNYSRSRKSWPIYRSPWTRTDAWTPVENSSGWTACWWKWVSFLFSFFWFEKKKERPFFIVVIKKWILIEIVFFRNFYSVSCDSVYRKNKFISLFSKFLCHFL